MKTVAAGLALACTAIGANAEANISPPSGFSNYCSVTVPTVPGSVKWFFGTGSDPCGANIDANIRAAGLYDTVGPNQVIARCASSCMKNHGVGQLFAV